ncbi:AAA family ATPase [Kitasatospora sp. MAP12-44]|uniref:AAA family ATPase n=1 Tax=unclassified Kitasatospora TaxID=2633591 RepID=UPI002473AEC9|nr:AAA family ATPase [Kitasatospora sp. MAP12-44]MDH6111359.1 nitric oxide reductase NorQ protein [Kitasatospora sp. MAP12-44]
MTTPGPPVKTAHARPGELRAKVARMLADRPADTLTIGEISKALGHSHGAVQQAVNTLVRRGEADQPGAGTKFRANAKTAAAAQAAVISPPGTHSPRAAAATARTTAPAATAPAAPASKPGGPIRRAGGQLYHPRELADLPDVEALNRLRDADVPVLLYGPPGTGKTSLVEAAFPDLLTVAGDGDTTVGDLIGEYTQDDGGGYVFQYGPLITAMTEGRALLIDDATLISPKVLAALYPAMDGRRQIQVKAHRGETIKAEPGFYVVAGHNPGVHGAILTEALSSRFSVQIQVGTDYDLALALRIDARVVRVARNLARQVELGEMGWAPQLRELLSYQKTEAVLGTKAALANLIGIAPLEDRDAVATAVGKIAGVKDVAPLTLGRQLSATTASAAQQPPGNTGSAHRGRSR